jgi:hypothetical protein
LIYFYFNTEIRQEVLRQVQRTLLSNDTVRRNSAGDTLSTRLSVFRISISRRRHSSIPNRSEKRRTTLPYSPPPPVLKAHQICWKKFLAFICPCLIKKTQISEQEQVEQQRQQSVEPTNQLNENSPASLPNSKPNDDIGDAITPLLVQTRPSKGTIDNDGLTCDTLIMKNEHDYDEILSDENDVTIHQTSFTSEHESFVPSPTPVPIRNNHRIRSKSDGHTLKELASKYLADNKSLR